MALFDKALKKGLGDALGKAASNLTQQLNQTPNQNQGYNPNYNQGYQQGYQNQGYQNQGYQNQGYQPSAQMQQTANQFTSSLETMFSGLTKSVQGYATEMSKNLKMCPNCGKPCSLETKFCDSCGTELPEESLAQGAVCPSCGKQNPLGTKFCQDCGTKLPHAVQEEQRSQAKDAEVMAKWDQALSVFPKWNCGGTGFDLEEMNDGILFRVSFPNYNEARVAVDRYRELLNQNGYQPAGQYPSYEHLYRMIGTTCYHVDLEHCFESDADTPNIYFSVGEPQGGFNYVKPQPNISGFNFKKLF